MFWILKRIISMRWFFWVPTTYVLVGIKENWFVIMHFFFWGLIQCSHRLEKYLNLEGFLEKSLRNTSTMKSTGKSLKSLVKSLKFTIFVGLSTADRELNQYKIVVPLFGSAYAAPNIGAAILYKFPCTNVSIISV